PPSLRTPSPTSTSATRSVTRTVTVVRSFSMPQSAGATPGRGWIQPWAAAWRGTATTIASSTAAAAAFWRPDTRMNASSVGYGPYDERGREACTWAGRAPCYGTPRWPGGPFRKTGSGSAKRFGPAAALAAAGPCGSSHSDSDTVLSAPCGGEPGDVGA